MRISFGVLYCHQSRRAGTCCRVKVREGSRRIKRFDAFKGVDGSLAFQDGLQFDFVWRCTRNNGSISRLCRRTLIFTDSYWIARLRTINKIRISLGCYTGTISKLSNINPRRIKTGRPKGYASHLGVILVPISLRRYSCSERRMGTCCPSYTLLADLDSMLSKALTDVRHSGWPPGDI